MGVSAESGRSASSAKWRLLADIAQVPDLEVLDQAVHLLLVEQQSRYDDHGDAVVGNAFAEIELGQNTRVEQGRGEVVHHLHGGLAARQQQHQDRDNSAEQRVEAVEYRRHDGDDDQQRQHLDAAQVEFVGMTA